MRTGPLVPLDAADWPFPCWMCSPHLVFSGTQNACALIYSACATPLRRLLGAGTTPCAYVRGACAARQFGATMLAPTFPRRPVLLRHLVAVSHVCLHADVVRLSASCLLRPRGPLLGADAYKILLGSPPRRGCGATFTRRPVAESTLGSSPRVRGVLSGPSRPPGSSVEYPRWCGVDARPARSSISSRRCIPAGAGNMSLTALGGRRATGPSPLVRGLFLGVPAARCFGSGAMRDRRRLRFQDRGGPASDSNRS